MLESLDNIDQELDLMGLSRKDILASIELEDIKNFLESLGVDEIEMHPEKGYLICPTICHNALHEEASMKLYWYQNNKIFKCYTECNEAMSIFKLYQKFIKINYGQDINYYEAEEYVKKCLKHIIFAQKQTSSSFTLNLEKYKYANNIPQLSEYPKQLLTYFSQYYHPQWLKEGITKEVMNKFHIGFSIAQNKITIPHFDIDGRLIGIRARALEEEEIKECGKYRPVTIGNTIYAHPLQFNLYGIYEHKKGIQRRKQAIIAEGEIRPYSFFRLSTGSL